MNVQIWIIRNVLLQCLEVPNLQSCVLPMFFVWWPVYRLGWQGIHVLFFLIEIICWAPWISQFRALSSLKFFSEHSLDNDFYWDVKHTGSFLLSAFQTSYNRFGTQCMHSKKQDPYCFITLPKQRLSLLKCHVRSNSPRHMLILLYSGYYFSLENSLFSVF